VTNPLSKPECHGGYPIAQLQRELDEDTFEKLSTWMRGQTGMICTGQKYNYDTEKYEPSECGDEPHGMVIYSWDVDRFFLGLPVID